MPQGRSMPLAVPPGELCSGTKGVAGAALVSRLLPLAPDADLVALCAGMTHTPFQSPFWLTTWLETLGRSRAAEAFWLTLDAPDGPVLALPLVRYREGGLTIISPPDFGVSDYAAPLLGPADRLSRYAASALWRAILKALPPADLLRFRQAPATIGERANPIACHPFALPSRISGWSMDISGGYERWFAGLSPSTRERLGKSGRRFGRVETSHAGPILTADAALSALSQLSRWQAERMQETGRDYQLDDPAIDAFYRRLIREGLENDQVFMMEMTAEGEQCALNFGVRAGDRLAYLRVGNQFGKWQPFALGILVTRLLIERAANENLAHYDFGAGDYEYKWRLGAVRQPLFDIDIPLGAKGALAVCGTQLRRRLSRVGWLKTLVTRLRGAATSPKPDHAA
jgi:CelD/BcsL family acetyltransferase involved in cellulose biosynthesis